MKKIFSLISFAPDLDKLILLALSEDIGARDVTSRAVVPASRKARARVIAKEDIVLCGLEVARRVFRLHDERVRFRARAKDGDYIRAGMVIAELSGPARSILECERAALNFLGQLSGIATLTSKYVNAVGRRKARIVATRKTHPGLRGLEKYAVVTGGGLPHRMRLDDMILIKDNHIAAAGGITEAVQNAKRKRPKGMKVEVEVNNLAQFREALEAGADIIMLDNMSVARMRNAVRIATRAARIPRDTRDSLRSQNERVLIEASGGMTLNKVKRVAAAGVDWISVGALTHSAPAVDISMEFERPDG